MSVEILIEHKNMTCGEGPHWVENTKSLYYVDAFNGDFHHWSYLTNVDVTYHVESPNDDKTVSFVIPCSNNSNELIIGNHRRVVYFDKKTSHSTLVAEVEKKGTNNRLNDGKCDKSGRLWLGTMGYESSPANSERGMGCLYSFDDSNKGGLKQHLDNIDLSNGLAWTGDDKIMFYADSVPRKVYAFDFDITEGSISNQRTVLDFSGYPVDDYGYPDGMCIDENNMIWLACFASAKIFNFDPETSLF